MAINRSDWDSSESKGLKKKKKVVFWIASGTLQALTGGLSGFPEPSRPVCNWLSMADF